MPACLYSNECARKGERVAGGMYQQKWRVVLPTKTYKFQLNKYHKTYGYQRDLRQRYRADAAVIRQDTAPARMLAKALTAEKTRIKQFVGEPAVYRLFQANSDKTPAKASGKNVKNRLTKIQGHIIIIRYSR